MFGGKEMSTLRRRTDCSRSTFFGFLNSREEMNEMSESIVRELYM